MPRNYFILGAGRFGTQLARRLSELGCDVIVGDRDAVLVIPPDIVEAVAQEALDTYAYEEFAEAEVARGRSLKGLFPVAGEDAKRDFEAWKARGRK